MKALKVDVSDIEAQVGAKEEKWMYCLRHEICLISVMLHSIFSRFGVVYVCIPGRRQGPIHVRRNSTGALLAYYKLDFCNSYSMRNAYCALVQLEFSSMMLA